MKFIIDKALSPKVANHVNDIGYHALLVDEISQSPPIPDKVIFDYAIRNDFIIVTADVDFGQLLALTQNDKPSLIIFRVVDQRTSNIIKKIDYILEHYQSQLEEGSLINVYERSIRTYKLPIS